MGQEVRLHGSNPEPPMSASGQKRTLRSVRSMSALPPKADMVRGISNVRFVPKRTFCAAAKNVVIRSPRRLWRAAPAAQSRQASLHFRFVPQANIRVDRSRRVCEGTGVSFVNCGSIDSSNKITDLRSRVPHTLTSGTFGTMPRRGGPSSPPPGGFRLGGERRLALARRGSGSFSGRGLTGPSG